MSPDSQYLLDIAYEEGKTTDAAVAAAKKADIVIIFGSAHSGEGVAMHAPGDCFDELLAHSVSVRPGSGGSDLTFVAAASGHDRANLSLGGNIDDLIEPVAAAAPPNKTIVVVTAPGSILTPW